MTKRQADALGPRGPGALAWFEGELVPALPDLRDALAGTELDPQALAQWIREPLARYRVSATARAQMAQRSAVIQWLEQAARRLDEAIADGTLAALPAFYAEPALWLAAQRRGHEWRELLARRDAAAIALCLADACAALKRERTRQRRPSQRERDMLLALVVRELRALGLTAAAAAHHADLVLVACAVPSPEASVARAARRARRAISVSR